MMMLDRLISRQQMRTPRTESESAAISNTSRGVTLGSLPERTRSEKPARTNEPLRLGRLGEQFLLLMGLNPSPRVNLIDLLADLEEDLVGEGVLGIDLLGQPVKIDLESVGSHPVLIEGSHGAGKSALIRTLVASLALTNERQRLAFALIEPGGGYGRAGFSESGLHLLSYLPSTISPLATTADEIEKLLYKIMTELEKREMSGEADAMLVLVLDDLDSVLALGNSSIKSLLIELFKYRGSGCLRCVLGLNDVQDPEMVSILNQGIPARFIGRTKNGNQRHRSTAKQKPGVGTPILPGRFVALADDDARPFEAAFIDDYDLHFLVTTLRRKSDSSSRVDG